MKVNGVYLFMSIFKNIGFRVVHFDMNEDLKLLHTKTSNALINIISNEEHMLKAKKNICTVKDHTRITLASLHFQHIPDRLLIELVFGEVF